MLSPKENALRAILGTGELEYPPICDEAFFFCIPSAIHERPKGQDGKDWFGCDWRWFPETFGYAEVFGKEHILEDVTEWKEVVKFPNLDEIDFEACAKKDLENFNRDEKLLEVFWESGPFERTHHLMGFEGAFYAMYDEPEAYKELIEALTDFRIEAMRRVIAAYKPDIIFTHDDVGTAKGPMISMELYEEFIKPSHMRLEQFIKSQGVIVCQHSCGMIEPFIGDMIECGATMINHLQGRINNQEEVLKKWGDKVCFFGITDPRVHDPDVDEAWLRGEMRRLIDTFGPYGRYVIDPFSMHDFPNRIAIMTDEVHKYGAEYYAKKNAK